MNTLYQIRIILIVRRTGGRAIMTEGLSFRVLLDEKCYGHLKTFLQLVYYSLYLYLLFIGSAGWSLGWSVGRSVKISLKDKEVTLPCFYRSTCSS